MPQSEGLPVCITSLIVLRVTTGSIKVLRSFGWLSIPVSGWCTVSTQDGDIQKVGTVERVLPGALDGVVKGIDVANKNIQAANVQGLHGTTLSIRAPGHPLRSKERRES